MEEMVMSKHPLLLVAVDLEVGTDLALDIALGMASAAPATDLIVLHVFEPLIGFEFDSLTGVDPTKKIEIVKKRVEDAYARFGEARPGARLPHAEVHVTLGRPANEIVWVAAHFDVEAIVVGSHGRRRFGRLLLGSVAEKVVRLAGCPVVVARPKNHDPKAKVPEIEPLCDDCAEVRARTSGKELWCARHSEHHVRAHTYSSAGRTEGPTAWEATTGT
jgi:nucleotide-binding universal stress UspA family protein